MPMDPAAIADGYKLFLFLNNAYTASADKEQDAGKYQHVDFWRNAAFASEEMKDLSACSGSYNLRYANGTIE